MKTLWRIIAIITFVILVQLFNGCAKDRLTMVRDGVEITVEIEYILQKKSFKSLEYDFMTGKVKITNFGSDTSEALNTFGELLLGYGIGAGTGAGPGAKIILP